MINILKDFYDTAMKVAAVNLNVRFTFTDHAENSVNLLNTPLVFNNANVFGTKLMSVLFTKIEMSGDFVEGAPGKSEFENRQASNR